MAISFGMYSTNIVVSGISFMELEPKNFECFYETEKA